MRPFLCTGCTVENCSCIFYISTIHGGRMPRCHGWQGAVMCKTKKSFLVIRLISHCIMSILISFAMLGSPQGLKLWFL
jgi:hypothetical protein